jgi:1-acyl-sn-glycerol-3-phosphate acyltransferase
MDVVFYKWARVAFYVCNKLIMSLLLGFNFYNLKNIKIDQQQIIVANHNSHLDAFVVMALVPFKDIPKVKCVGAKDYWAGTKFLSWFSDRFIGAILLDRNGETEDPLEPIYEALEEGYSIVIFPEGTRGEPEKRSELRFGVAKLAQKFPNIKFTPVFLHGLGRALPKGASLIIPFICSVNIGKAVSWQHRGKSHFMSILEKSFNKLEAEMRISNLQ